MRPKPRSIMSNPKRKALLKAFLALPKEAFADAAPPTTAKDWKDAEEFVPLSLAPAAKKGRRQTKTAAKRATLSKPAKTRKAKRA
jgi:hypothetical protein